jgi:DNA-directed RNA polymerase subunit K/omega
MIKTLPLENLKQQTKTLYEAVEIIAKRARQINQERRAQMEMVEMGDEQSEDGFEDTVFDVSDQLFEKKAKPTRQAIEELMNGDLNIIYPEEEKEHGSLNKEAG